MNKHELLQRLAEDWVLGTYVVNPGDYDFETTVDHLETDARDEGGNRFVEPYHTWECEEDLVQRIKDEVRDLVAHFGELLS
jgi:hypothetical protein